MYLNLHTVAPDFQRFTDHTKLNKVEKLTPILARVDKTVNFLS